MLAFSEYVCRVEERAQQAVYSSEILNKIFVLDYLTHIKLFINLSKVPVFKH